MITQNSLTINSRSYKRMFTTLTHLLIITYARNKQVSVIDCTIKKSS